MKDKSFADRQGARGFHKPGRVRIYALWVLRAFWDGIHWNSWKRYAMRTLLYFSSFPRSRVP